ncbi:unnamed protein product [Gordionus sp. m RMFG-2023]|uniref:calnexin-like n=1 Tax=Gordionus sp. m RMFG-2023 TaxID=3053472 RepID=UPI0030E56527
MRFDEILWIYIYIFLKFIYSKEYKFIQPRPKGFVYFSETFENLVEYNAKWVKSQSFKLIDGKKYKYDGVWGLENAIKNGHVEDNGLLMKVRSKHYAISTPLFQPFQFDIYPFMLQYEVKFQKLVKCSGAYVKLISRRPDLNLLLFNASTPYTLMFGPDLCGNDPKLHFVIGYRDPLNGIWEERHCKRSAHSLISYFPTTGHDSESPASTSNSTLTRLFTLILKPDSTFMLKIDNKVVNSGHLSRDFHSAFSSTEKVKKKVDPPPFYYCLRSDADNPKYIWFFESPFRLPPVCDFLPTTHSKLSQKSLKIKQSSASKNASFHRDLNPFQSLETISAIGLELWSMDEGILFDNFIITAEKRVLEKWTDDTFYVKRRREEGLHGLLVTFALWAQAYPFLWLLYLTLLGLPMSIFIIYFNTPTSYGHIEHTDEYDEDYFLDGTLEPTNIFDYDDNMNKEYMID